MGLPEDIHGSVVGGRKSSESGLASPHISVVGGNRPSNPRNTGKIDRRGKWQRKTWPCRHAGLRFAKSTRYRADRGLGWRSTVELVVTRLMAAWSATGKAIWGTAVRTGRVVVQKVPPHPWTPPNASAPLTGRRTAHAPDHAELHCLGPGNAHAGAGPCGAQVNCGRLNQGCNLINPRRPVRRPLDRLRAARRNDSLRASTTC